MMPNEVSCKSCLQVQIVEYKVADVGGTVPKFCSYCGSSNIQRSQVDRYWYYICDSLNIKRTESNAELVRLLYEEWTPNYGKFKDYALHVLEEAKNGI